MRRFLGDTWQRLSRISDSERGRLIVRTLYYLAIIVGLALTHLDPDRRAVSFVYQAF